MCGIVGWLGSPEEWPDAHGLLAELAAAHEDRGKDAAGWAVMNTRGQLVWQRRPGLARALFAGREYQALRRRRITMAIGHTRHATSGAPAMNGNNHPHLARTGAGRGWWVTVHNGHLPDHRLLAARHGLRLTSGCDSEVLVRALARYREQDGPQVCLGMGGSQSVLALNTQTRRLYAWTNGEMPLVAFRVEGLGGLWWASTQAIAEKALVAVGLSARFAEAQPHLIYRMGVHDGQVVMETERVAVQPNRGQDQ